jgi:hypothetical protein
MTAKIGRRIHSVSSRKILVKHPEFTRLTSPASTGIYGSHRSAGGTNPQSFRAPKHVYSPTIPTCWSSSRKIHFQMRHRNKFARSSGNTGFPALPKNMRKACGGAANFWVCTRQQFNSIVTEKLASPNFRHPEVCKNKFSQRRHSCRCQVSSQSKPPHRQECRCYQECKPALTVAIRP